jgi:S-adenosylmethionine:tRNA ribosyltransferase-isomerase
MTTPDNTQKREPLLVSDFDFDLPEELIAQQPPAERGASRMLALDRATGACTDSTFAALPSLLNPGDFLVLNDSRVIPARLYARRTLVREKEAPTGQIEVMLTEPVPSQPVPSQMLGATSMRPNLGAWVGDHEPQPAATNQWRVLVRPGRKVAIGERLIFPGPSGETLLEAEVLERGPFGERLLAFKHVENFFQILDRIGHIPLPPYIHRDDAAADRDRYQTVFARKRGSVAAPTAGLHFTDAMLENLRERGVEIARITLHVGLGTFAPLRVEKVADVRLHRERYTLSQETAAALNRARAEKRRIVAAGTTVVRTLESVALRAAGGQLAAHSGEAEIFISPGFQFRVVSALLTNFHLPQSSLLMLVSAFAGPPRTGLDQVLAAYRHAVHSRYRFFSYGDCMFLH